MDNSRDVRSGLAVVPWCAKNRCWILPSGKNQVNRKVYRRDIAVLFAHRINQLLAVNL